MMLLCYYITIKAKFQEYICKFLINHVQKIYDLYKDIFIDNTKKFQDKVNRYKNKKGRIFPLRSISAALISSVQILPRCHNPI